MSEGTSESGGDDITRSQHGSTHGSLRATQWIIVLVAVLVVTAVGLVGVALGHSQSTPKGTIVVTGSGTVQGTPDTVSFQIGVQNVTQSAVQALSDNNARVSALENSLLGHGVTHKDMQTSGLDIYENTNDQGTVTGFTVVDDLNVTMHQIGEAGAAIDAAVHAVGNGVQLYGVSFSISNESKLLAAARAKAMQNARTEASQVASGGNASLGAIEKITDQENSTSNIFPYSNFQSSGLAASVPLKPGSQAINVQVSVVYALNG
jgi:uncharacterized protein YggE